MNSPQTPALPPHPRAYLVRRERTVRDRTWPVDLPDSGIWKVTGEAGSGVTSFLIDTAADRIAAGADPNGVVVITASKESGARVRQELSDKLATLGFVADEPIVRSVHSLAFALLRAAEPEDGGESNQIRLISGAEQDFAIRELLQGHVEDGGGSWPEELRPALPMVGFARQLRDFLLRAVERTLTPAQLKEMGEQHNIPTWSAAGDFLAEYQDVMALYGARSYSASELVDQVLRAPLPRTWHTVIVDDAQHLDPASGQLVSRLIAEADLAVVGGDLEQSVFRFRGAAPLFFANFERDLHAQTGMDVNVVDLGATRRNPAAAVAIAPSEALNHATVVDALRRAHLGDGVPWSDMAVIVRSASMIEPLRRALLQAGVPVAVNPTDVVLSEQKIVMAMLLGLRALRSDGNDKEHLSMAQWRQLLLGPVGGVDPVTLRRLLRGLRRWQPEARAEDTLRELLNQRGELPDFGSMLTQRELDILTRMRSVLEAGRAEVEAGGSVEEVLWAVWSATKLADSLMAIALRGGAGGSQADRDLDAMMSLFDAAGDFTERRPTATIDSFIAHIEEQELPTGVRDRRTAVPDAVPLLTAHGAAGREFRRVIVSGVQELTWPTLSETGTLMRQEDLIDLVDEGIDPATPVSHTADRLKEENHLFHMAVSRAIENVLVTAVDCPDGDEVVEPSRFVEAFAAQSGATRTMVVPDEADIPTTPQAEHAADEEDPYSYVRVRVLAVEDVIAELRRVVTDPEADEEHARQAARQLVRMAEVGIPGADPGDWWGVRDPSTSEAMDPPSRLSPSRIEGLLQCPMRNVLERDITATSTDAMTRGTLVHYFFEALGRGADPELARADTITAYTELFDVPEWKRANDLTAFEEMLDRAAKWVADTRGTFDVLGVEVPVHVEVAPGVVIGGRIDRLEREGDVTDDAAPVHVVDLKTSKYAVSNKEIEEHPQLLAYQLALSHGVWRDGAVVTAAEGETPLTVGGGTLVYPAAETVSVTTRTQAPKDEEQRAEFTELIKPLPAEMTGPQLRAVTGPHCDFCQIKNICPAQPEGEVTTRG